MLKTNFVLHMIWAVTLKSSFLITLES